MESDAWDNDQKKKTEFNFKLSSVIARFFYCCLILRRQRSFAAPSLLDLGRLRIRLPASKSSYKLLCYICVSYGKPKTVILFGDRGTDNRQWIVKSSSLEISVCQVFARAIFAPFRLLAFGCLRMFGPVLIGFTNQQVKCFVVFTSAHKLIFNSILWYGRGSR